MTAAYSRIVPRRGETMSDGDVTEVEVVLDGVRFYVEARQDDTEHEVGSTITEGLGSAMDAIKTLGSHVTDAVKAIEPDHFSIQLGFEFKLEQGTLVAMLVRGSTTANVTVNLQWDKAPLAIRHRASEGEMTSIAGLGDDQRQRLARLLRRCAVQVQAGGTTGTGFFIAPQQVMTCRHVVSAAIAPRNAAISVTGLLGGGDEPRTVAAAVLAIPPGEWPDIAILRIAEGASRVLRDAGRLPDPGQRRADEAADTRPRPSLTIRRSRFTAGFPAHGKGRRRNSVSKVTWSSTVCPAVHVVSLQSGLVVGILRITKGSDAALGGFGTMLADVLDQVPLLQPLVDRPPAAAREWIKTVGATTLKKSRPATGRPVPGGARRRCCHGSTSWSSRTPAARPGSGTSACGTPTGRRMPASTSSSGPRPTWATA